MSSLSSSLLPTPTTYVTLETHLDSLYSAVKTHFPRKRHPCVFVGVLYYTATVRSQSVRLPVVKFHSGRFPTRRLKQTRNPWQSPAWLACSCAVGATWRIWLNDTATCTLRKLSNSSRKDVRNDCPVQIQHKNRATGNAIVALATLTSRQGCSEARFLREIIVTF